MDDKEYRDYFEKVFKRFCRGREDHEFNHYNQALGMRIYGKEHYKKELLRRRMLPFDAAQEMAEEWDKKNAPKKYDEISPKALSIINSMKLTADRNGNITLGSRAIKALKEIGAMNNSEYAPRGLSEGGFS